MAHMERTSGIRFSSKSFDCVRGMRARVAKLAQGSAHASSGAAPRAENRLCTRLCNQICPPKNVNKPLTSI